MANTDPHAALGQAQSANGAFAQFFAGVSQALTSGSATPEFSDFTGQLDYSELLRLSKTDELNSASYPGAAAVENIHQMAAVLREYGLRTKGKNQYYQDGISDAQNESDFYNNQKTHYAGMLQGLYTEGSTS